MQASLSWTSTIPASLKPGKYLIRHEAIALHQSTVVDGTQFYPSCAQLEIVSGGTASPPESSLVTLPGAYGPHDAGIYIPDLYGPILIELIAVMAPNILDIVYLDLLSGQDLDLKGPDQTLLTARLRPPQQLLTSVQICCRQQYTLKRM